MSQIPHLNSTFHSPHSRGFSQIPLLIIGAVLIVGILILGTTDLGKNLLTATTAEYLFIEGQVLDQGNLPYGDTSNKITIDPQGTGSRCGTSTSDQIKYTCKTPTVNPYYAKTRITGGDTVRIKASIPKGFTPLISLCKSGTNTYGCKDHPEVSWCRAPISYGKADIKLTDIPSPRPSSIELFFKYIPENQGGFYPNCDSLGLPVGLLSHFNFEDGNLTNIPEQDIVLVKKAVGSLERVTQSPKIGNYALRFTGSDNSTSLNSYVYLKLAAVSIPIKEGTILSYDIAPLTPLGKHIAVDLLLDDGTYLRDKGIHDQGGVRIHPAAQATRTFFPQDRFTNVRANLSSLQGRTIKSLLIAYDDPGTEGGTSNPQGFFNAQIDEIFIFEPKEEAPPSPPTPTPTPTPQPVPPPPAPASLPIDVGTDVVVNNSSNQSAQVRLSPGALSTNLLGTQGIGSYGNVIQGSKIGTKQWWEVDFQSGVDGWVFDGGLIRRLNPDLATSKSANTLPNSQKGDLDNDGFVTDTDGVLALRCAAELDGCSGAADSPKEIAADVDCDGKVTDTDGVKILRKAAELPETFCGGTPPPSSIQSELEKHDVAGGYRLRTDTNPAICTAHNPLTGLCSCPSKFRPVPFAAARGSGQSLPAPAISVYDEAAIAGLRIIFFDLSPIDLQGIPVVGVLMPPLPETVAVTVPYVQFAAVLADSAFRIYNAVTGPPAPGSPGNIYLCVNELHKSTAAYQGGYSFRADGAHGTQTNDLTTREYSCPSGTLWDEVAHALGNGDNHPAGIIYSCRNPNAILDGENRDSYGGMFQTKIKDSSCIQGNAIGDQSVTGGWAFVEKERDFARPSYVSFKNETGNGSSEYSCSCRAGYIALPIANTAGPGGEPSILWLCQRPIQLNVKLPVRSSKAGLVRVRVSNSTTGEGISAPIFLQNDDPRKKHYRSVKITGDNDFYSVFFANLPSQTYLIEIVRPYGYKNPRYSICRNVFDGSCPKPNSFHRLWDVYDNGEIYAIKDDFPVRTGEVVDVYFALEPD